MSGLEKDYENEDEGCLCCPNCNRHYDDCDYDYQTCSKCGWDADKREFDINIIRNPSPTDYESGDADILTGRWN